MNDLNSRLKKVESKIHVLRSKLLIEERLSKRNTQKLEQLEHTYASLLQELDRFEHSENNPLEKPYGPFSR